MIALQVVLNSNIQHSMNIHVSHDCSGQDLELKPIYCDLRKISNLHSTFVVLCRIVIVNGLVGLLANELF